MTKPRLRKNTLFFKIVFGIILIIVFLTMIFVFEKQTLGSINVFSFFWGSWKLVILGVFAMIFLYPHFPIRWSSIFLRGVSFGISIWSLTLLSSIIMFIKDPLFFKFFKSFFSLYSSSMNTKEAIIWALSSFIINPIYFIILGIFIAWFYKKFLSYEHHLTTRKTWRVSLLKIILAISLSTILYILAMTVFQILPLYKLGVLPTSQLLKYIFNLRLWLGVFIYGLVFIMFYLTILHKAKLSKGYKVLLFTLTLFSFTKALLISYQNPIMDVFTTNPLRQSLLFLSHLLSIFGIGFICVWIFSARTNKGSLKYKINN